MSADNYLYVRRDTRAGRGWTVTEESASADKPKEMRDTDPHFAKKLKALEHAQKMMAENYIEYGIRIESEPSSEYCPACHQVIIGKSIQ